MNDERIRRKWLYSSVVALIEWGLLTGAAVAATYDALSSSVVLMLVGAILLCLLAVTVWSAFLGREFRLKPQQSRRIRLSAYLGYPTFIAVGLLYSMTFGWKYIAAARPDAFTLLRADALGSVLLLIASCILLFRWQTSLQSLENAGRQDD